MNTSRDRLMYAQNWEDPRLELQALAVAPRDRLLAIACGGCTVLSLLAAGPLRLEAVDLSETRLRVLEQKCATVCALPADRQKIVVDQRRPAEPGRRDRAFLNAAFAVAGVRK